MNRKYTLFTALAAIACCALIALSAAAQPADKKPDATGTWTWSVPGRNGGPYRTNTLTLKAEDTKLTGKLTSPGRGGATNETAIADGKVEGDSVSFCVVREFNGNSMTNKYSGKVSADAITGKMEFNRNGEPSTRDWAAKRSTETK